MAAEIEPILAEEAKQRMVAGGGDRKSGKEIFPYPIQDDLGQSRDHAAKLTQTNGRYVQDAKRA